jgi:thiamine biosynthesis lipoprotein
VTVVGVAGGPSARTVHVERCMGTAFSIDIRDRGEWSDAVAAVVAWLHHADASPEVAAVLELCARAQRATGGYFTPLPEGRLDPTGLVKGWSIEHASDLLGSHGAANHAVNGGGDVQLAGESAPGRPWTVGIVDPHERTRLLTSVEVVDLAVATSGVSERGAHIVDPFTGRAAHGVAAVTVVGPRLTDVDTYATAAFAMGRAGPGWVETLDGFEALFVADDGSVRATSGWRDLAGQPAGRSTVRARMPSVARSAASGITGKMPAPRYFSSISLQS